MDGLVQYAVSRKWTNLLEFQGPTPADGATTAAFERSVNKFGAHIVAQQKFVPGSDPRQRQHNDPALMSAVNRDFDVVFVADSDFDFARTVPYHLVRPRPVIGSIDLEPVAWHWDHNGAPQVNSRFEKKANGRHMAGADWAAWVAVKMIVQAVLHTRAHGFQQRPRVHSRRQLRRRQRPCRRRAPLGSSIASGGAAGCALRGRGKRASGRLPASDQRA